jgi:hypothetical protein
VGSVISSVFNFYETGNPIGYYVHDLGLIINDCALCPQSVFVSSESHTKQQRPSTALTN